MRPAILPMTQNSQGPQDRRMRKIRRAIRTIGSNLTGIHHFLQKLPEPSRDDARKQLQRAFEAGLAYGELQHVPMRPPVNPEGLVRLGPALRQHILETRKVYGEIEDLRRIVDTVFEEQSQKVLREIIRREEDRVSGTQIGNIPLMD